LAEDIGISQELGPDGYCFFVQPGKHGQGDIVFATMLIVNGFILLLFVNLCHPWSKISRELWRMTSPCFTQGTLSPVDWRWSELQSSRVFL
jgi:hypothetical protein